VADGDSSAGIRISGSRIAGPLERFQLLPLPGRDFVPRGPPDRKTVPRHHQVRASLRQLQAVPPHGVSQAMAPSRQRFLVRGRCGRCHAPLFPTDEAAQTPAVLGAVGRLDAGGLSRDAARVGGLESRAQDDDALVADFEFFRSTAGSLIVEEERRLAQIVVAEGLVLFDDDFEAVAGGAGQLLDFVFAPDGFAALCLDGLGADDLAWAFSGVVHDAHLELGVVFESVC